MSSYFEVMRQAAFERGSEMQFWRLSFLALVVSVIVAAIIYFWIQNNEQAVV